MRRKRSQSRVFKWTFSLPIIVALLTLGCGLSNTLTNLRQSDEFPPTRTPMPTFTPTANRVTFVEVPAIEPETETSIAVSAPATPDAVEPEPVESTFTPEPTDEPASAPEPTEEASADNQAVTITVKQDMNVRGGPGTSYPVVGLGPAGASSAVVGRNVDSSWLQVEYPPGSSSTGWVYAKLVEISGSPAMVDVVQVAPPPEPVAAAPPPQEEAPPPEPPPPQYQFTPTGWHASENAAIVHFKGRIKDEAGNSVNGYSIRLTNWAWSIISHPTGASHWYPDKGDGEWDISGIPLFDGQGWWWLSVVRYDCDFWGGFDSQCNSYTTLSEEVKIQVKTPEESIINADWICHWDCDKGIYTEAFRK